jgi:hypothetical protein
LLGTLHVGDSPRPKPAGLFLTSVRRLGRYFSVDRACLKLAMRPPPIGRLRYDSNVLAPRTPHEPTLAPRECGAFSASTTAGAAPLHLLRSRPILRHAQTTATTCANDRLGHLPRRPRSRLAWHGRGDRRSPPLGQRSRSRHGPPSAGYTVTNRAGLAPAFFVHCRNGARTPSKLCLCF